MMDGSVGASTSSASGEPPPPRIMTSSHHIGGGQPPSSQGGMYGGPPGVLQHVPISGPPAASAGPETTIGKSNFWFKISPLDGNDLTFS